MKRAVALNDSINATADVYLGEFAGLDFLQFKVGNATDFTF